MRFGIFYEHQLPRPWSQDSEARLISDALEQVELADRLGIDYVWEVEHHFLEEYSHSSASEVFLGAASQRTERIRLGFGIVAMPPGYQHPARVAEKVAMLDLVSGGRVEFGTGETASGAELGGFGVDRATKREAWSEAVDVTTRMFVEQPFAGWDGRFVRMPARNVVPKPIQKPHPPLWVACSRRETIQVAAERGMGALSFSFVEPEQAKEYVDEYYDILGSDRCVPAGFAVNPSFAVVLPMMMHPEESVAIERGIDGAHFFGYSLAHYYAFGDHCPGRTNIWNEFLQHRDERGFARAIVTPDEAPLGVRLMQEGLGSLRGAIGTPDQVRDLVRRYEASGVDQVIFVLQAGPNRHEHICESLELFAAEVMPEFAEVADERERERREKLAEAMEAAIARRPPPRDPPSDVRIAPLESGPPAPPARGHDDGDGGSAGNGSRAGDLPRIRDQLAPIATTLKIRAARSGERGFTNLVRKSDDRRLERTVASQAGLRILFGGMARRFRPKAARGFGGAIQYELRTSDGDVRRWHIAIDGKRARSAAGRVRDPALTIRMGAAEFARVAAGELDPMTMTIDGRIQIDGDVTLAARLGDMFGATPAF